MKITPCGIRGTAVVADPAFMEYGGDTTCFLVEGQGGELVQVDAGSGVRGVNARLRNHAGERTLLLLMTHYHLDHLLGFPWLAILHDSHWSLEIAAPAHEGFTPADVMPRILAAPLWPVHMSDVKAAVRFTTLADAWSLSGRAQGGLSIRGCSLHHSGGCTAYRFDEAETGASAVIATDFEWDESTLEEKQALLRLCAAPRPADVLFLDGQFAPADYGRCRGWGHSRWSDAAEIARQAGVPRLRVIHHAPGSRDAKLRGIENELRRAAPGAELARQGVGIGI